MKTAVRFLILTVLATLGVIAGVASGASAGGWAVTTLDAVPTPVPGQPVRVGFTILQHGVTPVDLDSDVAIEVVDARGSNTVFPARLDGPTGHYVADVVFPTAGTYEWTVHQGWFEPQSLGTVTVAVPAAAVASSDVPTWLAPALAVTAGLLGLLAVLDLLRGRARRSRRALA